MALVNFQLGKAGLTDQFIEALRTAEKTHKTIKITLLPSSTRDKAEAKKIGEDICAKLSTSESGFNHKLIGFTLTIRRYNKKKALEAAKVARKE